MSEDYYDILGVSKNASDEDIKKAYKKKAKQYHPDLNSGDTSSEGNFKKVNEAFSVLGNKQKRSNYDQFGKDGANFGQSRGQSGFGGFEGFDFGGDPFSDIFESFFSGSSGSRKRRASRGADLQYDIEITLEEAYSGVKKSIIIPKFQTCDSCNGSGAENASDISTCPTCRGTGRVSRQQRTPFGVFQTTGVCPDCNGQGQVIKHLCQKCRGSGKVRVKKTLDITIPSGVETGNKLKLANEGEAGERGVSPGDLYVRIFVKDHEIFERDGQDISAELPISFVQATIGAVVDVPTLSGGVELKIPPGTQNGTQFRMRGKGMPSIHGNNYGDEFIIIQVKTPQNISKKQKELLMEFEKGDKDKPYDSFLNKVKKWLG